MYAKKKKNKLTRSLTISSKNSLASNRYRKMTKNVKTEKKKIQANVAIIFKKEKEKLIYDIWLRSAIKTEQSNNLLVLSSNN